MTWRHVHDFADNAIEVLRRYQNLPLLLQIAFDNDIGWWDLYS